MNKYVLKATALAIGALVAGSALAAASATVTAPVDLDAGSGQATFAKELAYVTATPLVGSVAKELNFKVKAGFGISGSSTRYVRIDFGNAALGAAYDTGNLLAAASTTPLNIAGLTDASSAVVAAGGTAGANFVVIQVSTAGGESVSATGLISVSVPSLRVTSTASPVTATYTLHETGTSASTGTTGNAILNGAGGKSASIALFGAGYSWDVTPAANLTARVEDSFGKFSDGTTTGVTVGKLGTVKLAPIASTLNNVGVQVTTDMFTDFSATKTNLILTGDFSAVADNGATPPVANGVFLQHTGTCALPQNALTATVNAGKTTATVDLATIDKGVNTADVYDVCYKVKGNVSVPTQTITGVLDVTSLAANGSLGASTVTDAASKTVGDIVRDGTELTAPFGSVNVNHTTRLVLTSSHNSAAKVTVTPILSSGSTCTAPAVALSDAELTIPANGLLHIPVKSICTATTDGKIGLKLTIAAPKSKIEGVLQQYRNADASTGNISADHTAYPLARPAQ